MPYMTTRQLTVGIAVAAGLLPLWRLFFVGMIPFNMSSSGAPQGGGLVTQDITVGSGAGAETG